MGPRADVEDDGIDNCIRHGLELNPDDTALPKLLARMEIRLIVIPVGMDEDDDEDCRLIDADGAARLTPSSAVMGTARDMLVEAVPGLSDDIRKEGRMSDAGASPTVNSLLAMEAKAVTRLSIFKLWSRADEG